MLFRDINSIDLTVTNIGPSFFDGRVSLKTLICHLKKLFTQYFTHSATVFPTKTSFTGELIEQLSIN